MSDPSEFLAARLAEDEAAANLAASRPLGESWDDGTRLTAVSAHIKRHDPARVLREVEAKRKILAEHQRADPPPGCAWFSCARCKDRGSAWPAVFPCQTLRALAAVYSDHPDYDRAWTPSVPSLSP